MAPARRIWSSPSGTLSAEPHLGASALVKRYVREDGSDVVCQAMQHADGWFTYRIGFIETLRAVSLAGGGAAARPFRKAWPALGVVEIDERLAEDATRLTLEHGAAPGRSARAPTRGLTFATWDQRLRTAAVAEGLTVLPTDAPT